MLTSLMSRTERQLIGSNKDLLLITTKKTGVMEFLTLIDALT